MDSVVEVPDGVEYKVYFVQSHHGDAFPAVDGVQMAKEEYMSEDGVGAVTYSDLRTHKLGNVSSGEGLAESLILVLDERSVDGEFI